MIAPAELTASVPGTNEPPRLTFIPNQSVATDSASGSIILNAGTRPLITLRATEPNPQNSLVLTAFFGTEGTMPAGASFTQVNIGTGVFTWTPQVSQMGVWGPGNASSGKPGL